MPETGSVPVLKYKRGKRHVLLGPLSRANLNKWAYIKCNNNNNNNASNNRGDWDYFKDI